MADKLSLEDIQKQQAALSKLAEKYAETRDPKEIAALNEEIAKEAAKLEAMAQAYADQLAEEYEAEYGQKPTALLTEEEQAAQSEGFVEVVLTPGQRQRILEATGVDMESVILPDPGGIRTKVMPHTDPREIEALALAKAKEQKQAQEILEETQKNVEQALKDFEANASPEALALLEKAKAEDPTFLAGLGQDK